jgi:hypothetical protein
MEAVVKRTWLPPVLLVLAALQAVSPLLFRLSGSGFLDADRPGEPAIVPAGYAFAIWGLVEVLTIGYAVWAVATRSRSTRLKERLAAPLAVVFAGFSLWLLAVVVEPRWTPLVIFVVMVVALLRALRIAFGARDEIAGWSRLGRGLLWTGTGVYTGWASIAVWVNLTTALADSGAPVTGSAGIAGQLAVLAGATATACAIAWWSRGLVPYVAAAAWAFVGAAIGASGAGEQVLAVASVVGIALLLVVTGTRLRAVTA